MNKIEPVRVGNIELGEGKPKICVPITGRTTTEIIAQAKKIKSAKPDLVEWRADLYDDVMQQDVLPGVLEDIGEILGEIPLLFTFRTKKEGGNRDISVKEYRELNELAAKSKTVRLVDVEVCMDIPKMKELISAIHQQEKPVIGSHHRFDITPSENEMLEILKTIEKAGADILKLAVMPHSEEDVQRLMKVTKKAVSEIAAHPVVTMSMGTIGVKTRICGESFGSSMTFACVGEASAPGQMEIENLRSAMEDVRGFVEKF